MGEPYDQRRNCTGTVALVSRDESPRLGAAVILLGRETAYRISVPDVGCVPYSRVIYASFCARATLDRPDSCAWATLGSDSCAWAKLDRSDFCAWATLDRSDFCAWATLDRSDPCAWATLDRSDPCAWATLDRSDSCAWATLAPLSFLDSRRNYSPKFLFVTNS